MKKNILALDLGMHSCGFAITRTGIIVSPLENYFFEKENYDLVINKIKEIISKETVELFVLGYPLYPSGDKCPMTLVVENFASKLKENFPNISVEYQDERNSTLDASSLLLENGVNMKKQKKKIDSTAACVILTRFIENNNK